MLWNIFCVDEGDIAKKVLKKHLPDLSDLLAVPDNMSAIGIRLYSEDLIPKATHESTITSSMAGRAKANLLLLALEATIDAKPQSLRTLIEILRRNDALKVVADKMDLELKFCSYIN